MASKRGGDPAAEGFPGDPTYPVTEERGLVRVGEEVTKMDDLRQMTFQDILESFGGSAAQASAVIESDQFGAVMTKEQKASLVGQPLMIVKWSFHPGDFGEFVSCWIVTRNDQKFILNDGSTGIYAQLKGVTENTGRDAMLACPKGLRVSKYTYTDQRTGEERPAETYYVDVSL